MISEEDLLHKPNIFTNQQKIFPELVVSVAREIISELRIIAKKEVESVDVNNLDQVEAALHNELNKALKPLLILIKELIKIQKESNNPDIDFPEEFKINNLNELKKDFEQLSNDIKNLKIEVQSPSITVTTPEVIVNNPPVNIPAAIIQQVDLTPLIKELKLSLNKIRTNDKGRPLAVRISDGQNYINQLHSITEKAKEAFASFNGETYIRGASSGRIDPATEAGQTWGTLVPVAYDYVSLSPADQPTTVTFKRGGSSGTTVATLALTYSGSDVSTVTRT